MLHIVWCSTSKLLIAHRSASFADPCATFLRADDPVKVHYPQLPQVELYDGAAVARSDNHDPSMQHFASDTEVVLMLGDINNDAELRKWTLGDAPPLASSAELVARLYRQRKYHALSSLRGSFAFVLLDLTTSSALGARSACGTHPLYQGAHDASGGLLLTTAAHLTTSDIKEVPKGTFVFGSRPGRLPHTIGVSHVGPVAESSKQQATSAAAAAMAGLKLNLAKQATVIVGAFLPKDDTGSQCWSRSVSATSLVSLAESDESAPCGRSIRTQSGSSTSSVAHHAHVAAHHHHMAASSRSMADTASSWRRNAATTSTSEPADIPLPSSAATPSDSAASSLDIKAPSFEPTLRHAMQAMRAALKETSPVGTTCTRAYVPPHLAAAARAAW
jgi:hypothetical protein